MRTLSIALLLALAVSGCATSRRSTLMSQETVNRLGRHELAGARADVYRATLEALRALGYGVAQADPDAGQIRTDKKPFRTQEVPSYAAQAWGTPLLGGDRPHHLEREYWIAIRESSAGHSAVTANPYLYSNGQNVSGQEIWDLDTEQRAWNQLFGQIDLRLRRAPPAAKPTPRPPPLDQRGAEPEPRQPPAGRQPAPPPPDVAPPDAGGEQQPPAGDPAWSDPDQAPPQPRDQAWPDSNREPPRQPQPGDPAWSDPNEAQPPAEGEEPPRRAPAPSATPPAPPRQDDPGAEYQNPFQPKP